MDGGRHGRATAIVAVVLADVALELTDALTFAAWAFAADRAPHGRQLLVLAALIVPRVAFAMLGGVVLHGCLRARAWARSATIGYLALIAVQGATGMFLLWGAGRMLTGRLLLTAVNLAAIAAAHRATIDTRARPASTSGGEARR